MGRYVQGKTVLVRISQETKSMLDHIKGNCSYSEILMGLQSEIGKRKRQQVVEPWVSCAYYDIFEDRTQTKRLLQKLNDHLYLLDHRIEQLQNQARNKI